MQYISRINGVETPAVSWNTAADVVRRHWTANPTAATPTLFNMLYTAPIGKDWSATDGDNTYFVGESVQPAHARLGASGCERWWNCPASVRLSVGQPNRETEAARRGTAAHEVAHLCLASGQDAAEYVGRTVKGVEIDAPIADGVQVYLDDCRATPGTEPAEYETRLSLAELDPPEPMFGTVDFDKYDAVTRTLYVKDYKNGYIWVSPKSKATRYYALAAMLKLGAGKPVSNIEVTICQPNGAGLDLKRDTFDSIELVEWAAELMTHASATQDPESPAVAGPWCTFCPVEGRCATQAAARLADAGAEFESFTDPAADPALPEVRLLTKAELGVLYGKAPLILAFLKSVAAAVAADTEGTGWKRVVKYGDAAWVDAETVADSLELFHEIDPWAPRKVVSPAVARGLITANLRPDHKTKKDAEAAARVALAGLIHNPKTGTQLVPLADKRPADTSPTNGAEFNQETC